MALKRKLLQNSSILILLSLVMIGCTSDEEIWTQELGKSAIEARIAVDKLGRHLSSGTISKASLLKQYATVVKRQSPELSELIDTLALDAGQDGPSYKSLVNRLKEANAARPNVPKQGGKAVQAAAVEYLAIKNASRPEVYGMMLTDPINVLADMSNGKLGRVEALSKEASLIANGAKDYGAGSQLVGNPQYGNWRSDSSGGSFWEWYGKYALFSSLFRSPIYYGGWANSRNYSYYGEAGRHYYSSPRQQTNNRQVQTRTRNKFQREGRRFQSPYAKSKAGSRAASMQGNSFKVSRASRMASARSGSSRTSRGSFSGK
ncbi:FIG00536496: hypothetical protein [hydrothermal vent metagenome]|uniref:Lipoprotein n=1 Tax=hydrothermal vent metagenome TaxID=652676 RepID=A0A3B1B333_9ZZZZ